MNFEKMWYALKEKLIAESENDKNWIGTAAQNHLNEMAKIEVRAKKEPKEELKEEPGDVKVIEDGKEMLKDIFGKDFVDNLEDLKQKLQEDDTRVILADAELEIPEELEKEAKEKNIMIGRAQCGDFAMRGKCPIPMPLPFLFPEGFLR